MLRSPSSSSFLLLLLLLLSLLPFLIAPCSPTRLLPLRIPSNNDRHRRHRLQHAELKFLPHGTMHHVPSLELRITRHHISSSYASHLQPNTMEKQQHEENIASVSSHAHEDSDQRGLRVHTVLGRSRLRSKTLREKEESTTRNGDVHTDYICADSC